jgi:hypothetical protein
VICELLQLLIAASRQAQQLHWREDNTSYE